MRKLCLDLKVFPHKIKLVFGFHFTQNTLIVSTENRSWGRQIKSYFRGFQELHGKRTHLGRLVWAPGFVDKDPEEGIVAVQAENVAESCDSQTACKEAQSTAVNPKVPRHILHYWGEPGRPNNWQAPHSFPFEVAHASGVDWKTFHLMSPYLFKIKVKYTTQEMHHFNISLAIKYIFVQTTPPPISSPFSWPQTQKDSTELAHPSLW